MTNKVPKVAVVILNWNGKEILKTFLPSVINNSREAELVIVDNQIAINEKIQTNEKILNHYVFDFYNIHEIESNLQKITGQQSSAS